MVLLSEVFTEVKQFINAPVKALETGCSFAWTSDNFGNLSTLNIAGHLHGTLLSLDNDASNMSKCKAELKVRGLDELVEFCCGDSVVSMEVELVKGSKFNFFWLDSEENEEHGLKEYDLALKLMSKPGVVCIDDYASTGSVKWKLSSEKLKLDSSFWKVYTTGTGLIVGFYKQT